MKATYLLAITSLLAAVALGFAPVTAEAIPPHTTGVARLAVNKGDKIVFMGDSITEADNATANGYVNLVVRALNQEGLEVTHVGAGVSGQKSNDMLARVDADVISHKPQWLLLSCGVNDVWHFKLRLGKQTFVGVPLEEYKKNITAIIDKAQAANIKVMILTATMIGEDPERELNKDLAPYNEFLRQIAKQKNCLIADLNEDMRKTLAGMLDSLKEEIAKALPKIDESQQADLEDILTSDITDPQLVKFALISQATPGGLAGFAQEGNEQQSLVDKLLADPELMKQMVVAGGAAGGRYGQAMKIYTDIRKVSANAKDGILQRFALGTSLEHAIPVGQRNPVDQPDAPATVDPVKRYLSYEKAFLAGELDPGFKDLSVWDCRFIGNGDESDEVLAWGREMLRNYNPDHVTNPDYRWRYVEAVKTDVKYGSQDQKNDNPSLGFYQNIINTGGVCGRRAFFGRFILRCFGVPCLARPQPGHATLVHWTPGGWVICLGATWGNGRVDGAPDTEFLAATQARMTGDAYLQVLRARWIGAAFADKGVATTAFWTGVASQRQQAVIEKSKAETIAAVGTDIGESNESKEKDVIKAATVGETDRNISAGPDGVITIPAVACSSPMNSTPKIRFMKSHLGGMQLHYGRLLVAEPFEYTFDAPTAGKYAISARVVTVNPDQHLLVAANDANETVDITAPYTLGKWDMTPPVEIVLAKGRNVLRFSRTEPVKGLTIKDFTLTPVK